MGQLSLYSQTLLVTRKGNGLELPEGSVIELTLGPLRMPPGALSASAFTVQTETSGGARIDLFSSGFPPGTIERCIAKCGALPGCRLLEFWTYM